MNHRFSLSKTFRVEGWETLEEEAISFSEESSMEDDKEDEAEGDSCTMGLWERLGFVELDEAEDMVSMKKDSLSQISKW